MRILKWGSLHVSGSPPIPCKTGFLHEATPSAKRGKAQHAQLEVDPDRVRQSVVGFCSRNLELLSINFRTQRLSDLRKRFVSPHSCPTEELRILSELIFFY